MSFVTHYTKTALIELMTGDYRLMTIFTAVALTGLPAAIVSFQRKSPSFPPTQNVDSAPFSLASARRFSGKYAIYAINAVTTAS